MRTVLTLLSPLLLVGGTANAASPVSPTLELSAVRVEVTWVESSAGIQSKAREYGRCPRRDSVVMSERLSGASCLGEHSGFAVLGKRDGQYVCLLFVLKPERTDDDRTTAVAHELLHCLLGDYHG